MCGIIGAISFLSASKNKLSNVLKAVNVLKHRGPDFSNTKIFEKAVLGHTRLSIIDTSTLSNQPFVDSSERFYITFNGEIFNYKALKYDLEKSGIEFKTAGDVEVLLELFKRDGEKCLEKLNGFFSFAIYDLQENSFFIARDRFGVKPLYYFISSEIFCFASEIKSILSFNLNASPDFDSLFMYLQLNYIPSQKSIFKEIIQLEAGSFATVKEGKILTKKYFDLKYEVSLARKNMLATKKSTADEKKELRKLLEDSVQARMVADVSIGCFLSGGIDSTIVTGLASQYTSKMSTFCLGFEENKYFDESSFAEIVSKKFKTLHHTFMVSNEELFFEFTNFLESLDEPFADSSALNVYILSKKTSAHVKTVLSGDGADEIFGGYNKHRAEWLIRNSPAHRIIARAASAFSTLLPKSRNSAFGNAARQLEKFNAIMTLNARERYWKTASISSQAEASALLKDFSSSEFEVRKNAILKNIYTESNLNDFLFTDVEMVLQNDMLVKVDRMSMAHGLEVRSPFLDWKLVTWGLALGEEKKINNKEGKIILKQTFEDLLPKEIINRKKHGFELPLYNWMNNELKSDIEKIYLADDFISDQNIFSLAETKKLKQQLFSSTPADAPAKVWALIIFNHWYKKHTHYFS